MSPAFDQERSREKNPIPLDRARSFSHSLTTRPDNPMDGDGMWQYSIAEPREGSASQS